jgi:hypothetical protein
MPRVSDSVGGIIWVIDAIALRCGAVEIEGERIEESGIFLIKGSCATFRSFIIREHPSNQSRPNPGSSSIRRSVEAFV